MTYLLLFQLKYVAEKLSPEEYDADTLALLHVQVENFIEQTGAYCEKMEYNGDVSGASLSHYTYESSKTTISRNNDSMAVAEETSTQHGKMDGGGEASRQYVMQAAVEGDKLMGTTTKEEIVQHAPEIESRSPKMSTMRVHTREDEIVEQFVPGVYVTLVQLPNGAKIFKRVRFRYILLDFIFVFFSVCMSCLKQKIKAN